MKDFLKGIVVGMGGIAPGLSGSVLLVIFGLYQKTINAIGTIFKNFIENLKFLIPLFTGFAVGILLFSKVINFLLENHEMYTRFLFLGLILGTVPMFYKEVKKEGFNIKYYLPMVITLLLGIYIFYFNGGLFPKVENPNLIQSMLLGVAVAASSIVPGVDSAAILSSLGLYELYVSSLANLNIPVLVPAALGLGIGALVISYVMNLFISKHYTITFSIIFGLFLSVIPSVILEAECNMQLDIFSFVMIFAGLGVSLFFGNLSENIEKIKTHFKKKLPKEKAD